MSPAEVGYFAAGSVVTSLVSNFVEGGLRAGLIHREDRLVDAAETAVRATLLTGLVMLLLALASAPLVSLLFDNSTAGVVAASMSGGICSSR
ncbi:oligosaccharide flippase family protein [Nocardioides aurantiacus]|uniref:oligosaccharide flippase family protein n=1 Tax=Nocardioides aurantiacus TaxID=86796 RepID=UPI00403F4F74